MSENENNAPPPDQNIPQPAVQEQKPSRFWWKAGCALLAVVAVISLAALLIVGVIFGFAAVAGSSISEIESIGSSVAGSGSKKYTEEFVSGRHFSSDKILVIDIRGVISSSEGSMYEIANSKSICDQLKAAQEDSSVKAVIINLDTPGGEVTAADEIYHEICKLRGKPSSKPVVAMMNSLAASGGYYVSVACDTIVANKLTLTGSIGVIIEGYNYADLFNKIGVKSEIYKSGPMKDMLDGSRPRTEAERVIVQRLVDSTYGEFLNVVSKGRNIKISDLKGKDIVDGRVLDGQQALDAKLIDKLGYFEDAVKEAATLSRISNYKVVRYSEAFSFAKIFEKMSANDARAVKLNIGGIETQAPPLRRGCLYFLPSNW